MKQSKPKQTNKKPLAILVKKTQFFLRNQRLDKDNLKHGKLF